MKSKHKSIFQCIKERWYIHVRSLKKLSKTAGTTFIETLVTIAIIAILMTTVAIAVLPFLTTANEAKVKSDIAALNTAMMGYFLEKNDYPDVSSWQEDIKKFMNNGKVPIDPWTNEAYKYIKPGPNDMAYEIRSNGPNKKEGDDDDIISWDLDKTKEAKEPK